MNEVTRKLASKSSSAISAMDDKDVVSITNSVLTPKTTQQDLQLQFPKENDTESKKVPTNKLDTTHQSNSSCCKEKPDSSRPEVSVPNTAREYAMDPSQLQALHAAMKSEQAALLPSPLLPYMMPGFPPIFSPHIPTPMNSGLMQPMFGIENMFSYGPVLPQALMGLSPSSLLQQYQQNLQGALMQQRLQLHQLQQTEKPKSSQISARLQKEDTREPVLDSTKRDKKQGTPNGTHSPSVNTKMQQLDDSVLHSHCIVSKAACGGEGKDGQLYDCLACEVSFTGDAGLIMHLENPQHRQRVAERLNSKEHASPELPHDSPSSTSQPTPPGEQRSSSTAPSVLETPSGSSDQCTSDTRRPQSSSSISALPETTESSTASLSYHIISPSSVTSCLTSLAKTCQVKPADSADGCCNES